MIAIYVIFKIVKYVLFKILTIIYKALIYCNALFAKVDIIYLKILWNAITVIIVGK